jgi:hypothetical protein
MQNIPLFILDLLCLPITMMRILFIYFYGSRYGIHSLYFLDVIMHSKHKYFNQLNKEYNIDTENEDIRLSINKSSRFIELSNNIKNDIDNLNKIALATRYIINNDNTNKLFNKKQPNNTKLVNIDDIARNASINSISNVSQDNNDTNDTNDNLSDTQNFLLTENIERILNNN